METKDARMSRDRIQYASRLAVHKARSTMARARLRTGEDRPEDGKIIREDDREMTDPLVGTTGAIAYALLDIANAIREGRADNHDLISMVFLMDEMADALADGKPLEEVRKLASQYQNLRVGTEIDQSNSYVIPEPSPAQVSLQKEN